MLINMGGISFIFVYLVPGGGHVIFNFFWHTHSPPTASISSKKMIQAFLERAISNSSLTIRAPSPTYFCTSSEPMTRIKQASVRLATALASNVLPVPGGPNSSTPLGGSIPSFTNLSGWGGGGFQSTQSLIYTHNNYCIEGFSRH